MKIKYIKPELSVLFIDQEDSLLAASVDALVGGVGGGEVFYTPLETETNINDGWVIE